MHPHKSNFVITAPPIKIVTKSKNIVADDAIRTRAGEPIKLAA
jgi:hypothetical protein